MIEYFKKGLLTGIGVGLMTKNKVEEFARKVASEAKLTEEEGKKFVDEFIAESKEVQDKLETKVQGAVIEAISKLNLATKEDIAKLEAKIAELEKRG